MKLITALFLVLLLLTSAAFAGQLEDGKEALLRRDYQLAMKLLQPLADKGSVEAQIQLGEMYGSGHGVKRDDAESLKWYRKAADQGNAEAQSTLGRIYESGWHSEMEADANAEAAKWYRKAADQGYTGAQISLSQLYNTGRGVKQDYEEAYFWRLVAARLSPHDPILRDWVDRYSMNLTAEQKAAVEKRVQEWKTTSASAKPEAK